MGYDSDLTYDYFDRKNIGIILAGILAGSVNGLFGAGGGMMMLFVWNLKETQ